jgi:hypothetical protein
MAVVMRSKQPVSYACVEAKIIRTPQSKYFKGSLIEDQGVIAEYRRPGFLRSLWQRLVGHFTNKQ